MPRPTELSAPSPPPHWPVPEPLSCHQAVPKGPDSAGLPRGAGDRSESRAPPSRVWGRPWASELGTERRTEARGQRGVPAGRAHLVITAAGGHAVLDVGHEGVNEPRVVPHGLAAGIGRAQVPGGENREGVRRQGSRGGRREEACRGHAGGGAGAEGMGRGWRLGRRRGSQRNEDEGRERHPASSAAPSCLRLGGLSFELSSAHPPVCPPGPQAWNFMTVTGSGAAGRPRHMSSHLWAPAERELEALACPVSLCGAGEVLGGAWARGRVSGWSRGVGATCCFPMEALVCPSRGLLPKQPGPIRLVRVPH